MKKLINFIEENAATIEAAKDQNQAAASFLRTARNNYKLDLKEVLHFQKSREFIYKVENMKPALYIILEESQDKTKYKLTYQII